MANAVLAIPALSDAATLSSSTSPGTLPVSNLQNKSIQQVWRASDASAAYVVADLGSPKEINFIGLLGHTGSSRSYARVRAAASEGDLTAAPAYDSGLLPYRSHQTGYDASWASGVSDEEYAALNRNHFLLWLAENSETYRYWRIDIVDPNNSFIDAGRLYISKAFQPANNMDYGLSEGIIDPSRTARTAGGKSSSVNRTKYRYAEMSFSFLSEEEMFDNIFEIEMQIGSTEDALLIIDPAKTSQLQRRSYYGTLKNLAPIVNQQFSIFQKSLRIEEITA